MYNYQNQLHLYENDAYRFRRSFVLSRRRRSRHAIPVLRKKSIQR